MLKRWNMMELRIALRHWRRLFSFGKERCCVYLREYRHSSVHGSPPMNSNPEDGSAVSMWTGVTCIVQSMERGAMMPNVIWKALQHAIRITLSGFQTNFDRFVCLQASFR
mmetsp:Transcript_11508/g.18858  ORF Transcript_11508/g.18858 Transcript_11508/m.18858 type:complete len:110 (-) Transcript_11508:47-376(-)